jgi:hypothetical protein
VSIEKLTDEELCTLCDVLNTRRLLVAAAKALRIIDQLTAALEAAEKDRDNWKHWRATAVKACDRCEEREKALQARVVIDASTIAQLTTRAQAAESELADLRGRVGRALVEWKRVKRNYQVPMYLCVALEALRGR